MKTDNEHFDDWESHFLGFGYGSGEEHVLPALKAFMAAIPPADAETRNYDYRKLEEAVGPVVAWLLLNLCGHAGVINYGSSPRFGWLTEHGYRLKSYIDGKTAEELVAITDNDDVIPCTPEYCNCSKEEGCPCHNPFWRERMNRVG